MMKLYYCKMCDTGCIGMPHDGDLYTYEVCTETCLRKLRAAQLQLETESGGAQVDE